MELLAVVKSQAARFGNPQTADRKAIFLPDFMQKIAEEFRFVDVPKTSDDFNLSEGTVLRYGTFGGGIMNTLKIYGNGMIIEGPVTTDVLDAALDKIEELLLTHFGARVVPHDTLTRMYVSHLEVRPTVEALEGLDLLAGVRERLAAAARSYGIATPGYSVTGFSIGADPELTATEAKAGRFLFERRANRRFDENVFFSDAPLPTAEHLALLNELETTLTSE